MRLYAFSVSTRFPGSCDRYIERMPIRTSGLNDWPAIGRTYRHLLPLMPLAIEQLDATGAHETTYLLDGATAE